MDQVFSEIEKEAVRAPKGTVLMRQGEVGRSAYFVVQGRLLVEREMNGENYVVAEIGARDIVGEMAILDDSPRSATVTVIEDALLVLLDKNRIRQIIRRSPTIAELILKLLCYKLRNAHSALQNLSSFENPEVWIKICKNLRLCHYATQDPSNLYKLFADQLESVIGISRDRLRDTLDRLAMARILISESKTIEKVDAAKIDCFVKYGREEFINEDINKPSEVKEYQACQSLLRYFGQIVETQASATIHYDQFAAALVASNLWKHLRPAMQHKRASKMASHLLAKQIVNRTNIDQNQVEISFPPLKAMQPPTKEINEYEKLCSALLSPKK